MKFTKMSLVAALLIGSSAFAIDNIKTSGDAKVYYTTGDAARYVDGNDDASLFNMADSAAQTALSLSVSADLVEGVSAGAKMTGLSTLGLEGQLVGNVWEGTNGVSDSWMVNDLWLAATLGKTTVKVGRMELDTPMVFSEKWSIVENTFEAAVVINQDIPATTLVGAYVGGSNGYSAVNTTFGNGNAGPAVGIANRVQTANAGTTFSQFYNGAYAVGVVNNSWAPLTAQAWYYDATNYLNSYWIQADLNIEGAMFGAQYNAVNYLQTTQLPIAKDASASVFAVMGGYAMKDVFTAKIAYSQTAEEKDSSLGLQAGQNLATFHNAAQSKLYTEAWWNYGYVTRPDTSAINVTVEGTVAAIDLGLYYTNTTTGANGATPAPEDVTMSEVTLSVGKSFGPLDTSLVYINTTADDQNVKTGDTKGSAYNMIQAYLTLNF